MGGDRRSREMWYHLPEFVELELFPGSTSSKDIQIWKADYDGSSVTCLHVYNSVFTIAEAGGDKLLSGRVGWAPMGQDVVGRFLQLYWRYMFESVLGSAGYKLDEITSNHEDGNICLTFSRNEEGVQ